MSSRFLSARIVVLNYNGEKLLRECLPSIVKAADCAKTPTEITLLDNRSTDEGLRYVQKQYPSISIEVNASNRVLCSFNDCLPNIKEDIVILMNNDIRVSDDFVDPLVHKFQEDNKTFLVAPKVMDFDGKGLQAGRSRWGMRYGFFWCSAHFPGYEAASDQASETVCSGFGAVSRDIYLKLGGYDPRYLPGILEDVDLCWRAKQEGYRLYYEPKSVVYHKGQATFKETFGGYHIQKLAHRNTFLFMWKNFSGFKFWLGQLCFIPARTLLSLVRGKFYFLFGLLEALKIHKEKA